MRNCPSHPTYTKSSHKSSFCLAAGRQAQITHPPPSLFLTPSPLFLIPLFPRSFFSPPTFFLSHFFFPFLLPFLSPHLFSIPTPLIHSSILQYCKTLE